jgi:hypothetical protein
MSSTVSTVTKWTRGTTDREHKAGVCLDHLIILNETHLRGILQEYVRYYNLQRTHLEINKEHLNRDKFKLPGRLRRWPC